MVEAVLGWSFRDRRLLDQACAGSGVAFERLELLGDAVADAVLLPWIYRWSTGSVAIVAGARSHLTANSTLGRLATRTGLRRVLPPDVRRVPKSRADLVEALIGAAHCDGGWPAATTVCESLFGQVLDATSGADGLPSAGAARIETSVARIDDRSYRWRSQTWLAGEHEPIVREGRAPDPLRAELDALVTGVDAAGDVPRDLWVEMSDEARAAMDPTELTEHADAAQTLRALLAGFDGIWYVPADGLSTAEPLWGSDGGPDGTLTAFEARVGHDLVRPVLERLALRPGTEQRRLALVGNAVLRSASVLRAFHRHPDVAEGDLDVTIQRDLAIVHLQVTALRLGLLDLLFPGERPVAAAALVRACLGAVAVDAGPEHAVGLATQWLDAVRVGGDDLDHVALISCQVQPDGVQVELITPDRELTWTLADAEAPRTAIAIQGISAALDSLPTSHDGHGLILEAPSRVVGALERTDGKVPPPLGTAVERFLARVRARDLRMVLTVPGDHPSDATAHRR